MILNLSRIIIIDIFTQGPVTNKQKPIPIAIHIAIAINIDSLL